MVLGLVLMAAVKQSVTADAWSLATAAAPYKGVNVSAVALDRPSYVAERALLPEFERETGIHVSLTTYPYESTLEAETLNFVSKSDQYDAILSDIVWLGTFASTPGWVVPLEKFMRDPKLADPALDVHDFFPVWQQAFTWKHKLYGLPFDSYSGLLYYNRCMLQKAGFNRPPRTWHELRDVYAPKLTDPAHRHYAYALQSMYGETQTADAFSRFIWDFGGGWFKPGGTQPTLASPQSIAGIEYRHSLLKYMPPGIVGDDHPQVVQLMAQGQVAMLTEWSSFYTTLAEPGTSKIGSCLGVTTEPAGPGGAIPALGGFAYMINGQSPTAKQNAAWLFIQWLTSKKLAKPLVAKGAVVARTSFDTDPAMQQKYPFLKPMVEGWGHARADWRPQIAQYPEMSEVVANWGTLIEQGGIGVQDGMEKIQTSIHAILVRNGYDTGGAGGER